MVHCHNSLHADRGMLAKEYVRGVSNGTCECNLFAAIEGDGIVNDLNHELSDGDKSKEGGLSGTITIVPIVCGCVVGVTMIISGFFYMKKKRMVISRA
eukprot:CAMPEP_0204633836 /NCGR_PEP_ID=MMETSP0717-20131115/28078_1 /ASSEMBLY_ACC=CAM_ASM_000666 /TAXON_ID=230516 /ORGANISM="Chaetoceros curvisetus" /LENGTH=97 /DNA_ID=CAMNT_0051652117 /DNA_START=168 /DNA_END=461 /DNA_ORIENTATION=+